MTAPPPAATRCRWRKGLPALDLDREHAVAFFAGDIGLLAVIDRLGEARLDQSTLEKGAAPFGDRQVHHVGHDIDTGHQPAAEP